jgi:allantoicase
VRLAAQGIIRSLDIDTHYFTGNYPPQASVDATNDADPLDPATRWTRILSPRPLRGNDHNVFACESDAVSNGEPYYLDPTTGLSVFTAGGRGPGPVGAAQHDR